MSLMELIGQEKGTILYGDRSAELVAAGGVKIFRAPFRGFVKAVTRDGAAYGCIVSVNTRIAIPDVEPNSTNVFEVGDAIAIIGPSEPCAVSDRIGLEVGTL